MSREVDATYPYQIKQATFCKYELVTPNKEIHLNFPQMLELRRKVNELTTFDSLNEIINSHNFALIYVADKEHLLYLDVPQLLKLQEELAVFFHSPAEVYV